ncbi:hypothetical protein FACS1894167_04770 [Synergistales bacterium]|nr:hypothetical protein FACS1894167_04770 [Synergistales bacterium]
MDGERVDMSSPRTYQPSFARGEITPLLHARVDLAAYATGLRYLKNFIVLPHGGVTRRPGFLSLGSAAVTSGASCPVRLVPFVYNSEDAMIVELYNKGARIWRPATGSVVETVASVFAAADLPEVKFVQNGNEMYFAHRDYPPQRLIRRAIDEQQINAWARQETAGHIGDVTVIPAAGYDELWAAVNRGSGWRVERLAERVRESVFEDAGAAYESCFRTLRVNYDTGSGASFPNRKAQARLDVYALRSLGAWACPAGERERARKLRWEWSPEMTEDDIQLDNGFARDAGIEIYIDDRNPLTILAVSPTLTPGG